jgi:MFS family permease
MGISTVSIGFYLVMPASESLLLLLMLCRFGQGVGLGGEWGGAVLLAIENAPPNTCLVRYVSAIRCIIGLLLSGGTFLILTDTMSSQDFLDYGWRIPFIASSLVVGFYIRLKITETPLSKIQERTGRVKIRFSPY